MTVFHVFYIPAIFSLGIVIGVAMGKRSAQQELALRQKQERERAERRKERDAG